jgi:hypothetical protein
MLTVPVLSWICVLLSKVGRAGEQAALKVSSGHELETTLDEVQPGGRGGREVQVLVL